MGRFWHAGWAEIMMVGVAVVANLAGAGAMGVYLVLLGMLFKIVPVV